MGINILHYYFHTYSCKGPYDPYVTSVDLSSTSVVSTSLSFWTGGQRDLTTLPLNKVLKLCNPRPKKCIANLLTSWTCEQIGYVCLYKPNRLPVETFVCVCVSCCVCALTNFPFFNPIHYHVWFSNTQYIINQSCWGTGQELK